MWYLKMINLIKRIFGLKIGYRRMGVVPLSVFTRGWFIGNFEPSVLKTSKFEVGVFKHSKGEDWPAHYHRSHDEYNVLVTGKMSIYGTIIEPESVFVVPKKCIVKPVFLEDCVIVCVKTPSIPGDKITEYRGEQLDEFISEDGRIKE